MSEVAENTVEYLDELYYILDKNTNVSELWLINNFGVHNQNISETPISFESRGKPIL